MMRIAKTFLLVACCLCIRALLVHAHSPQEVPTQEVKLPELRDDLARRVQVDQKARFELLEKSPDLGKVARKKIIAKLQAIDADNTKWMEQQIKKHGWLGQTLVGEKGAHNAWLLVQHADQRPKFQARCLKLMEAMPKGEVSGADLAYLTDRTLTAAGKPQRYGTQCSMVNGKAVVGKVEAPADLDARRKQVGLGPIAEYLKRVQSMYGK